MSFNLTLSTERFVICVTDRRLTMPHGRIVTERSNKLTTFSCRDAHGFITYNGIGEDRDGKTPSDWISDQTDLMKYPLLKMAERIKQDSEERIRKLNVNRELQRHTFVLAGYHMLRPFTMVISNYERLKEPGCRPQAEPMMTIEIMGGRHVPPPRVAFLLISTGARPAKPIQMREKIVRLVRRGASGHVIRAAMVKAVRDVAYQHRRRSTVGTSVMSGIVGPVGGFDVNSHIPGGATLMESPNFMSPGMIVTDVVIDVSGGGFKSRYDPRTGGSRIEEAPCPKCGSPVPEGYRRCGVCDHLM